MPNTLFGSESISADIASGVTSLGQVGGSRLQEMGTLFKEFRFAQGPTGHFSGHSSVMTGVYNLADIKPRRVPRGFSSARQDLSNEYFRAIEFP